MTPIVTFTVSGLAIVLLIVAKKIEAKRKRPVFISSAISKGDIHIRKFIHTIVHLYSEWKEKVIFFFEKQMRMHFRSSLNKATTYLKEKGDQYTNNMRDSRLLKKSDGISEFFKNMSNIEKGNGEIHDTYEEDSQKEEKELN